MSETRNNEASEQSVSPRLWIRVVVAYLIIPLVLLVCSGDINWWQAWIYALLIVVSGVGGRWWLNKDILA